MVCWSQEKSDGVEGNGLVKAAFFLPTTLPAGNSLVLPRCEYSVLALSVCSLPRSVFIDVMLVASNKP